MVQSLLLHAIIHNDNNRTRKKKSNGRKGTDIHYACSHRQIDRHVGLVAKASASRAEDTGFESHLRRDFSRSSNTSDLKIGTPVAILPGAWRYRVSAGTGWAGVSIL